MRRSILVLLLLLLAACRSPQVTGLGHQIPVDEAIRMAKAASPIVEVTRTDRYTAPPTVNVIYGKDKDGRELIAWVYTTVIRHQYADKLITADRAKEIAREHSFPAHAIETASLRVFQGQVNGRQSPIFWRLSTQSGWINVDAETEEILSRLDHE